MQGAPADPKAAKSKKPAADPAAEQEAQKAADAAAELLAAQSAQQCVEHLAAGEAASRKAHECAQEAAAAAQAASDAALQVCCPSIARPALIRLLFKLLSSYTCICTGYSEGCCWFT
jgi:hypothetical protein